MKNTSKKSQSKSRTLPLEIVASSQPPSLKAILSTENVILLEVPADATENEVPMIVAVAEELLPELPPEAAELKRIEIKDPGIFDCTHILKRDQQGELRLDLLVRTAEECMTLFNAMGVKHRTSLSGD